MQVRPRAENRKGRPHAWHDYFFRLTIKFPPWTSLENEATRNRSQDAACKPRHAATNFAARPATSATVMPGLNNAEPSPNPAAPTA